MDMDICSPVEMTCVDEFSQPIKFTYDFDFGSVNTTVGRTGVNIKGFLKCSDYGLPKPKDIIETFPNPRGSARPPPGDLSRKQWRTQIRRRGRDPVDPKDQKASQHTGKSPRLPVPGTRNSVPLVNACSGSAQDSNWTASNPTTGKITSIFKAPPER
ncbi:MAG: hypothetical protein MUF52_02615 [Syntrophobacteraceae bacterium]|jgi:hypothetical protein|nr:hypothetical protein [Syntrophobacteraceae bacterium]